MSTPVIGREGLLRLVEWAGQLRARDPEGGEAARASCSDDGADECPGRGAVEVVSGGNAERHSGLLVMLLERLAVLPMPAAEGPEVSTVLAGEHGEGKIQGWHRDRLAAVYVRQSSRQQVADHGESTRLQYGLAGRAAALGWPASRRVSSDLAFHERPWPGK